MPQFQPQRHCPNDGSALGPMVPGVDAVTFDCPDCGTIWKADGPELTAVAKNATGISYMPVFPRWIDTISPSSTSLGASTAALDSALYLSLTGAERVQSELLRIGQELTAVLRKEDAAKFKIELEKVSDDAKSAVDQARGARAAAQIVQTQLRTLAEDLDKLNLPNVVSELADLRRLLKEHIEDHTDLVDLRRRMREFLERQGG